MLSLEPVIVGELKAVQGLDGFVVRGKSEKEASKRPTKAIEVAFSGVRVEATNASQIKLSVAWAVHVVTKQGDDAATVLGAALSDVIGCLHGFKPGKVSGRFWSELKINPGGAVVAPDFVDQGLAEYAVVFETFAIFEGRK